MGGIIVYDSYAKLTGCEKIVNYFEERACPQVDVNVLFSKEEVKTINKGVFGERARERDFACDHDRNFYRNLPRF